MDEALKKYVRNSLLVSEFNLKAGKVILRLPETSSTGKLVCHLKHIIQNCEEVLSLIAPEEKQQPEMFPDDQPVLLDLDAVTVNGTGE